MTDDETQLLGHFNNLPDLDRDRLLRIAAAFVIAAEKDRQAAMPKNVVRFPIGRIVNERFCRDKSNPERVELDEAMRSIWHAKDALLRQEQSVRARWQHMVRREVAAREAVPAVDDAG